MKVHIAYGRDGIDVDFPDDLDIRVVEPQFREPLPDQTAALRGGLSAPMGSPPLMDLLHRDDSVGIIFNDITRATPNDIIISALVETALTAGVSPDRITLFNATGTHRANTDSEFRGMLSDELVDGYRIVQNDAGDATSHRRLGTTSKGTPVFVLKEFLDCSARILTGFIEPHFFAGFSGGGKAVVPGLAGLETVMANHRAAFLDEPQARWGVRLGNPLWEDLREAAKMTEPSFLVNVALNRDKAITAVFCGDIDEAHRAGCEYVKDQAMVPVDEPFDIVVTSNSGYPLDLNLYQSVKGMSAAAQIVKQGGSIVLAAECWDGLPSHGLYGSLLKEADSLSDLLSEMRRPDCRVRDMWQAHVHAQICEKAEVYVYAEGLSSQDIGDAKLRRCTDIPTTISDLVARYGRQSRICVLPEGPQTIPYLRTAEKDPSSGS